jgi:AcrR family transcriptional regulator
VLRDGSGQNLRDYLIATAARLIDQRGSAGLGVRDITREAKVADGVLYNYFEDKEDLLAHALLVHVGTAMHSAPQLLPPPGEGTVAENLRRFIDGGIAVLIRVIPAFAGLLAQPKVLSRFHAMVGGDAAFGVGDPETGDGDAGDPGAGDGDPSDPGAGDGDGDPRAGDGDAEGEGEDAERGEGDDDAGGRGLPDLLTAYLRGEQQLGRIDAEADVGAAVSLIVGAIHGQVLPKVLLNPPGSPITIPPGLAAQLTEIVLAGIAPKPRP